MTKKQLIDELSALRQKVAALEESVAQRNLPEEHCRPLYKESIGGYAAVNPEGYMRESEKKYRELMDFLPITVFECDQKANITSVNQAALKTLGYGQEDLDKGLNALNIIIPGDRERAEEAFRKVMIGELIIDHEYTLTKKDGSTFPALVFSSPITHNGETDGLRGAVIDIAARKRAEETLRESENRYRTIFENTGTATVILEEDTTISLVNREFEKLTGYTREEIVGKKSWTELVLKEDLEWMAVQHSLRRIDAEAAQKNYEFQLVDKAGQIKYINLNIDMIPGTKKSAASLLDITDRKVFESQLRQAQKMEAIGTLAGGIAHDFNNILSAILGYTDMALGKLDKESPLQRYLDQVYKAGERARDLVEQIITFSRQSEDKLRPLRISPIVKEVLKLLRAFLPSTIQIHQKIQSDPDTVLTDPTHIHQILMNLCTNAAHAMRQKTGVLSITLLPVDIGSDDVFTLHELAPGTYLKLTVSDTGVGIDPGIMERIFDPFFTTKKPGEGTGLGLSVVYGIVKRCGGTITVKSEVRSGTEFHVYLPVLTDMGEEQEARVEAPVPGGKEHILFVDDEEVIVELGRCMLTGLGYDVVGRTNSPEALELFASRPDGFDLVITDMTMPNMTGIELAHELMRIRPAIPVILCTGFSEAITPEKVKFIGLRELIMKPIIQRQIAEAVRRALDYKE